MEIIYFFIGVLFFYTRNPMLFLLLGSLYFFHKKKFPWLFCFLGVALGFFHSHYTAPQAMPKKNVLSWGYIQGKVEAILKYSPEKTQFNFRISHLNNHKAKALILLSCYRNCPSVQIGQEWMMQAKLMQPRNLNNPGGFEYKEYLLARHIAWIGTIKGETAVLINNSTSFFNFREQLGESLKNLIVDKEVLGIAQALTLGITHHMEADLWALFRHTGTTHLLVISGSHISLIAGLIFGIVRYLWARYPYLALRYPAQQIASIAGTTGGILYALLSGFAIPTQRAVIACLLCMLPNFLNIVLTNWQIWRYGVFLVLCIEPHAVLIPGFYLSFLAVAVLMAISQRLSYKNYQNYLLLQISCTLGLIPFTWYWFSYGAVNGVLANLMAIPWVSFIVVPLALLTLGLSLMFTQSWISLPLHLSVKSLLHYLSWIDHTAFLNITWEFADALSLFATILGIVSIFCIPHKGILSAVFCLWITCFWRPYLQPAQGEVFIRVLDVGQGLSVVIQTARHLLIYDVGMKFFHGNDMAQMVIIPYLKTLKIQKIDTVVISHTDLDHRGGLNSLEAIYPIQALLVNNPAFYHKGFDCNKFPEWQWDGVTFHFFPLQPGRNKNNSSCILQVKTKNNSVLLTGDIEALAEKYLVKRYAQQLASSVLIVPHHGSKTSSTSIFLNQVQPKIALISAGYHNRYHFPHQEILQRLKHQGIIDFNTANCGMITLHLNAHDSQLSPQCFIKPFCKSH